MISDVTSVGLLYRRAGGGRFYVIDDDGNRVIPPHPGEWRMVEAILGKDAPREITEARTGFNSDSLCLDCFHEFQMDTQWDDRLCPLCNSVNIKTTKELVDGLCPKCKLGTMKKIDTGLVI